MTEADALPVVVDSGSGMFKVGIAGSSNPLIFPPVVGRPKTPTYQTWAWLFGCGYRDNYVGDEAQNNRGILSLNFPIQRGIITNWDDYEKLWYHIYRDLLLIPSDERPLLLTEAPFNTISQRDTMAQILFEKLQVPALGLTLSAVLSMYALGCCTGIVLDCGESLTCTVPIFQGAAIPKAILRHPNLAGGDLTDYFQRLLTKRNPSFASKVDRWMIREIKEKHCQVAPYLKRSGIQTIFDSVERWVELPDGTRIDLRQERYMCPEALFQPSLIGIECRGVHQGLYDSILKCGIGVQQAVNKNVILCGGTTQMPGMENRIRKELLALAPMWGIPNVIAAPSRPYSAWLGGSVIGTLSNFTNLCISKSDYEEQGSRIIYQTMGPI